MSAMKRILARSFRDCGMRTVGFGDIFKGRMALEGFDYVKALGADGVRTALVPEWDGTRYFLPKKQIIDLKWMMKECQDRKLYVIPLLGTLSDEEHQRVWTNRQALSSLVECGLEITDETYGRTVVAAQDILNEPRMFTHADHSVYWEGFVAPMVAGAARIDLKRVLAIEPWPGARVDSLNPEWGPYWVKQPDNCIMSPHNYSPFPFTHSEMSWAVGDLAQKWHPQKTLGVMVEEIMYSVNVAAAFDVPLWYGEISARQDLPGAAEWGRYTLAILRGLGASWSWHYIHGDSRWHPNPEMLAYLTAECRRLRG